MLQIIGIVLLAALFFLALTGLLIWLIPIAFPAFGLVSFPQGMALAALTLLISAPWK